MLNEMLGVGNIFLETSMLYIIGCPRSGTYYMTQYLKQMGIKIEHEKPGLDGSVSWILTPEKLDGIVLHQVRNPIDSISSLSGIIPVLQTYFEKYFKKYINIEGLSNITTCMRVWYYWNEIAEKKAQYTYCIEDFDLSMLERYILLSGATYNNILPVVPENKWNKRKHRQYSWDDMEEADASLTKLIQQKAIYYGYKERNKK